MVQYTTEAIVLRLRKYREADALVTLFTKERGKVTGVAKGIYKPTSSLRGGVQPYSTNQMQLISGRSTLYTIAQSECLEMLLPLRQSIEAMTLGAYWAELLENFGQEEMADDGLYLLAKAGFLGLAIHASPVMACALEIRLIEQQGLRPDFASCCRCGVHLPDEKYRRFSSSEGGFLCEACGAYVQDVIRVNPAIPGIWQGLEKMALDKVDRVSITGYQLEETQKLLRQWIMRQTGKPMKTWQMMKKMEV